MPLELSGDDELERTAVLAWELSRGGSSGEPALLDVERPVGGRRKTRVICHTVGLGRTASCCCHSAEWNHSAVQDERYPAPIEAGLFLR